MTTLMNDNDKAAFLLYKHCLPNFATKILSSYEMTIKRDCTRTTKRHL